MPDSRDIMLQRIRAAITAGNQSGIARNSIPAAEEAAQNDVASTPRTYIRTGQLDQQARLRLFAERLHDYDANVSTTSAGSISQTVSAILEKNGQKNVIVADGLPDGILPAGLPFVPEREASIRDLDTCDGIVTACTVAIATTGTIVLRHGPGEGARKLTLIPDRHLCIVRADQVVETVPEAFDRLAPFATCPITFISGPSATADIEMTRIRGVHGPRFLNVVLVV
ncbi:MAG TPA: LUD domain-containing protein [Acidobacteriaceae bacterium]|nr:LUD domain-containing protein [Acidobacteriaceae bacterium]